MKVNLSSLQVKVLLIVAAGAAIRVPLDKSTVAFDALAKCVEEQAETVAANIFCAPATSATASGVRGDKSADCENDAGASEETAKAEETKAEETTKAEESKPAEDAKPLRRVKSKKFRSRPIPAFFAEMFDAPLR